MENQQEWLHQKQLRIEELTANFSMSKYNLLKISYLARLLDESVQHAPTCNICRGNLSTLDNLVEEIPHLDLIDHRQPYERQFNAIRAHFHQQHGFIPPYKYAPLFALAGILLTTLPVAAWTYFSKGRVMLDPILAAAAIGLLAGYFRGAQKDGVYRRAKKMI
ncbi:MAG: hypothetical protein JXR22_12850 [Prolixibacteraceae bacterium]|nr:hypothetical protein [Prolixibacteraceae bacterium]